MSESLDAFLLTGRTAVICGAASAMGDAIARTFAAAGANVVLGDVKTEPMEQTCAVIAAAALGATAVCRETDVGIAAEIDGLVDLAVSRFGRIDVLANIAGVIHDALVVDTTEADLDRLLGVNVKGVYFGCQSAVRAMAETGGSIVNMASSGGFTAIPRLSGYAMTKAAVVGLTRVLAAEVGRNGIRVNAVAPGYVEGGMTARHARRPDGSIDEEKMAPVRDRARRGSPLRALGEPDDIAYAFLYLASDASRYLTGQVIHANGGAHMP